MMSRKVGKLLRRAILVRWPPASHTSTLAAATPVPTSPSYVPTPAAVPRAPAALIGSPNGGPMKGRIQVVSDKWPLPGLSYVSADERHHGLTQTVSRALIVEFAPSHHSHVIKIINPSTGRNDGGMLGVTSHLTTASEMSKTLLGGDSTTWAGLTTVTYDLNSTSLRSSSTFYHGISNFSMWSILIDGSIVPVWEAKPFVHVNLIIVANRQNSSLILTNRLSSFIDQNPSWVGGEAVRFVFERIP